LRLLDKNSLLIALRALLRLATAFFFITTLFTIPYGHKQLLVIEDGYGFI
jgi:hypothetical protein